MICSCTCPKMYKYPRKWAYARKTYKKWTQAILITYYYAANIYTDTPSVALPTN